MAWVDVAKEEQGSSQPFVPRLVRDIMRSIPSPLCVLYHVRLVLIIRNQRYLTVYSSYTVLHLQRQTNGRNIPTAVNKDFNSYIFSFSEDLNLRIVNKVRH